jgi:hypothetical protein
MRIVLAMALFAGLGLVSLAGCGGQPVSTPVAETEAPTISEVETALVQVEPVETPNVAPTTDNRPEIRTASQTTPPPTPEATTAKAPPALRATALAETSGIPTAAGNKADDVLAYVGGQAAVKLGAVHALSDGSLLLGGGAADLSWLPDGVPVTALEGPMPESKAPSGRTPFLLHVSADLTKPLAVWTLAADSAQSIDVIKSTSLPGTKTGDLFISGSRDAGYFIARLDGNIVDAPPTRLVYTQNLVEKALAETQPWDVGSDGRVVYATGNPYSYDWFAVYRLEADGQQGVVEHWRTHWITKPDGSNGEWAGSPASSCPTGQATHSGIVLKIWGRGDFRSWTEEDFLAKSSDGNGGQKQGRWPLDAMFPGPYDLETKKTADILPDRRGYYGYKWGNTPCANIFTVAIDRRDNAIYLGGNNKSVLPEGQPDFEPWVVAMTADGELRWWQRLYSEEKGVSTPDQYVDGLVIDYSRPLAEGGAIVVVARSHGNNVNNFWNPSAIVHPDSPKRGFQDGFTGTNGNIHYGWIGKLGLARGDLLACTYFAEYSEGAKHQDKSFEDSLIRHWPHWRAGWPDLNTTRYRPHTLHVDGKGNVYVAAVGRRVVTTSNAHMEMPSPLKNPGAKGQWSDFVRVYSPELTSLKYSSLVAGAWDWETGQGASPHEITGLTPIPGGVVVTAVAKTDKGSDQVSGNPLPTVRVPDWCKPNRTTESGVLGRLHFEQ